MSTGGIVIAVILSAITLMIVVVPFFRLTDAQRISEQVVSLSAHYERVLTNIRDLDEDLALGKIQQDFHQDERSKYVAEGINLLQQMDQLQPAAPPNEQALNEQPAKAPLSDLDDMIEQAVSAKRKERQVS